MRGNLLAFDPGKRCGWACFHDGVLTSAGVEDIASVVKHETDEGLVLPDPTSGLVLVEMPQWRPNEARDVNALLSLAVKVGELKAAYARGTVVELVRPVTWKGSVDKKVHNRRVLVRLTSKELAVLPKAPRAKSYDHNMVDACGLGLWKLGRMHGPAST